MIDQTPYTQARIAPSPTASESARWGPVEIRKHYNELLQGTTPQIFSAAKIALAGLASSPKASPREILEAISHIPGIEFLLTQDSRITENYTIREHESCWLAAFERYIAPSQLARALTDFEIRILGTLHDIGKPLPDSKADQASFTITVIRQIRDALPIENSALDIICSLIGNDPLGKFVVSQFERQATLEQRKAIALTAQSRLLTITELTQFADLVVLRHPDDTTTAAACVVAREISERAKKLGISAQQLFNLHRVTYLCDVAAYTYDAIAYNGQRSKPGIEFVFVLNPHFQVGVDNDLLLKDPRSGTMQCSPPVAALFDFIESALPT